jgi:hypothetical protein
MMEALMPEEFDKILEICIRKIENNSTTVEACLEDFPQYKDELRELLPLVVSLKTLKELEPSQQFSKNAGNRLAANLPEATVTFWEYIRHIFRNQQVYLKRRMGMPQIIITVMVAISLLVGGSYSVQASAPGDLLYKLDRGIEELRLQLTANPEKQIALRMQFATERLKEAEKMLQKGKIDEAVIAFKAYEDAVTDTIGKGEVAEHEEGLNREAVRTMTQEDLALQQGTLDRIRLSWDEVDDEHQARNAYQEAYQISNWGIEWLLGPREEAPQGPVEDSPAVPPAPGPQGPSTVDPNGPAPHGPTKEETP